MNRIDAADTVADQRALAAQKLLSSGAEFDLSDGEKRRGLVLLGCDEVHWLTYAGMLQIDHAFNTVKWRGRSVSLTAAEFRILCCLVGRRGAFVPSRQIYDAVHGPGHHVGIGEDGHRNATRVHIKRIRRKFRMADREFDQIETWYSHGYRWRQAA